MDISKQFMEIFKSICFIWVVIISCCCVSYKYVQEFSEPGCTRTGFNLYCAFIPEQIPGGITHVYLQNIEHPRIEKGTFAGNNWNHVIYLQFFSHSQTTSENDIQEIKPYGMEGLKNLKQLEIISPMFTGLDYGSFAGLGKLQILNFTGCAKLQLPAIIKAVNGSDTLPRLEVFSITFISTENGIDVGKDFFNAFETKPLKLFDVHKTDINILRLRYLTPVLDTLEYVNASSSNINQFDPNGMDKMSLMRNPKLLDASYTVLPKAVFSFIKYLPFIMDQSVTLNLTDYHLLSNFEAIDITGVNSQPMPLLLKNLSIYLSDIDYGQSNWTTKRIVAQKNKLLHLDLTINCKFSTIQMLDLSANGIEYFRPRFCTCCLKLEEINLSDNKLSKMALNNRSTFEQLLAYVPTLQTVKLSANQFTEIPKKMFTSRPSLKVIDLSNNLLQQVSFYLNSLENLTLLNLQRNSISILDEKSISNLESYTDFYLSKRNLSGILDLRHNPISCATCATLSSITLIANTELIDHSNHQLSCRNSAGQEVPLDTEAVLQVKVLCYRAMLIKLLIYVSISVTVLISIVAVVMKKVVWKKYIYKRNMEQTFRRISENRNIKEYVLFISYFDTDYNDMLQNIYEPLKALLAEITETGRDLICFAEKDFSQNRSSIEQSDNYLEKSEVALIVQSRNYFANGICRTTFDHILSLNKPFIIFKFENITETDLEVPSHFSIALRTNMCFTLADNIDKVGIAILEKIPCKPAVSLSQTNA